MLVLGVVVSYLISVAIATAYFERRFEAPLVDSPASLVAGMFWPVLLLFLQPYTWTRDAFRSMELRAARRAAEQKLIEARIAQLDEELNIIRLDERRNHSQVT